MLNVPVNNFSVKSGRSHCFLAITSSFWGVRWFRDRVVCALDYEAGDQGSIPGSGGTTDWLFSAGW